MKCLFIALLLFTGVLTQPSRAEGDSSDVMQDLLSWLEPPPHYGGFEHYRNVELVPKSDRWDIGDALSSQSAKQQCLPGTAMLVSDLCAMGHLTKDAAMVASWVLDHVHPELKSNQPVPDPKELRFGAASAPPLQYVVFSNNCMTRLRANQADKRAPLFHSVLQHWFLPTLSDTTFAQRASRADAGEMASLVAEAPSTLSPFGNLSHPVQVLFAEDLKVLRSERPGNRLCFETVAKRGAERWRWFRSRDHAYWFRQRLWRYFNIKPQVVMPANQCRLNVTILERDEDRHFGEQRVGRMLTERLAKEDLVLGWGPHRTCRIRVRNVKFDRFKGSTASPPPHPEQLRILGEETDVLLAAHGAGLAALVAMRPGTAAVEFFPQNFRYFMYEELARLAGIQYFGYESPVVHPPKCCSGRGSDLTPVLKRPQDGNGVGARACKKCDIRITDDELTEVVLTALETVVLTRATSA